MPATFPSHAAAVLPLKVWRPRWFDGVALVIGSAAPDLAYPLAGIVSLPETHSAEGVLWFALPVTLVVAALVRWAAPVVAVHLPDRWALRDYGVLGAARHPWHVTVCSALIGAVSHVVWDGFTHDPRGHGWVAQRLAALQHDGLFGLPWWTVTQHTSTVVGGLVVLGYARHLARHRLLRAWHGDPPPAPRAPVRFWVTVALVAMLYPATWAVLPRPYTSYVQGVRILWVTGLALLAGAALVERTARCPARGAAAGQDGGVTDFRIERDTMGEVQVPVDALWRAQTQRAVENFPISGRGLEFAHIRALAQIKGAAAAVNADLGVLDREVADAIVAAASEVAAGVHHEHFPIDVFQTGSGTSSNMNANEVLASLAADRLGRPVHANDEVNASQSSNDVFPSSIHLAATNAVAHDLVPALRHLAFTLESKVDEFGDVVKAGRTHLMDATPVTLGQEFSGYAAQTQLGVERLQSTLPRLAELPLGGTAVGTGVNAPPGFAAGVIARLRDETGLPLREARNHFEAQGARDALVEASGQLRVIAVSLYKIANDIRWMGSGPRAGLRELSIPDLQPGSSIMPGKVNPVVCESVRQVCAQVIGNDAAVAFAGSQGDFELNVMLPVMARNLLESIRLLAAASRLLADRCVSGLVANAEVARAYAEGSPAIVTPLNRFLGYDEAAAVVKQALASGRPIRRVVIERGHIDAGRITEAELDEVLDVLRMTRP